MKTKLTATLFITTFLFFNSLGQFTYTNVSGGYEGISFASSFGSKLTSISSFSPSVSFVSRFKRHVGVGAQFSLPVAQSTKFSFDDAFTSSSSFRDYYVTNPSERYYAQEYDYDFQYNSYTSLFLRFYIDRKINFYVDGQFSFTQISESFQFKRPYVPQSYGITGGVDRPSIPEENLDFQNTKNVLSSGVKFGLTPHITDHLFLDFNLGWDFLFLGMRSFSHAVPFKYDFEGGHEYVTFRSQIHGVKTLFSIRLGVGYYF